MNAQPLTPPSDHILFSQRLQTNQEMRLDHAASLGMDDNTAAGMALSQEDSLYLTPAASPIAHVAEEKDNHDNGEDEMRIDEDLIKHAYQTIDNDNHLSCQASHIRHDSSSPERHNDMPSPADVKARTHPEPMHVAGTTSSALPFDPIPATTTTKPAQRLDSVPKGLAKVDLELDKTHYTSPWDISDKRPVSRSPSSLFQPHARYIGTQQSDRQTYNVEVTILTVDMDQCSLSGYLLIRCLTPEHPMLQTFFTGEIVGGPNQRHSFKTMDPAWGASDKVDLQHWLRFPAWRHLSAHAKRDMTFDFPLDNQPWHTQEHIFMRWKEHFLVPDHKQSNIQGASFEGFYYICLNQIEGKISGVYFHSKSEKYVTLFLPCRAHSTNLMQIPTVRVDTYKQERRLGARSFTFG